MRILFRILGLSLALAVVSFARPAWAQENVDDETGAGVNAAAPTTNDGAAPDSSVSFQQFYDQLSNQGTWINSDKYGYVFQPTENDPNWRPYTYGHWVNSEAGMTWASDDQFGWATDHYGRWVNLDGYGWVWVPGYTWGPAWVSWRQGDDDVGWAPLPPDSDLGIDYYGDDWDLDLGFHIGDDCDLAFGIGPWWYNFCPIAYIGDRDCWRHFRDRRDNFGFIGRTRNLTNINFARNSAEGRFGRVHAEGPSVAALNARANTRIQSVRLARASTIDNAGLHGNTLSVFAPRFNPATRTTARPDEVVRTATNVTVNRGTDINRAVAVNSHLTVPAASADQVRAAEVARSSFANARVATATSHFSRTFTGSLNTMRTDARTSAGLAAGANRGSELRSSAAAPETRFSDEAATRNEVSRSRNDAAFTGNAYTPRIAEPRTRVYDFAPSSQFRANEPVYHARSYAPAYHSYTPSYHSYGGSSFRSAAPAAHYSGGGYSHAASGGGGAHFSGGGGGNHAGGGGGRR